MEKNENNENKNKPLNLRSAIASTSSQRTHHTDILYTRRIRDLNGGYIDVDSNTNYLQYLFAKNGYPSESLVLTENDKGIPNGVCDLDSSGYVPLSRLPGELLQYKGQWDAATNTPTLSNPDTNKRGYVYYVSQAGNRFGFDWELGDWLVYDYNGNIERRPNTYNTDVRTVFFNGNGTYIPVNTIARLYVGYTANIYQVLLYSSNGSVTCDVDVVKNSISMVGIGTKPYLNAESTRTIATTDWTTTGITNGDYVDIVVNSNTNATDIYVVLYTLITE